MRPAALIMGFLLAFSAMAATPDIYNFDSRAEEIRFQNLTSELRCPKCQNQNIADSNAPISRDMREAVYRMMKGGADNEEIIGALESRFGEFIRYKPKVNERTIWLWATPVIVVLIGLLVVIAIVLRSRASAAGATPLSEDEQRRVEQILSARDNDA